MFGTVKLTRNADKSKFTYNGQGIAFDGKGYWIFDNYTARNIAIFGVDNSSSSHIDNPKHNFSVLDEGPTEKKLSIKFSKSNTKFCLSLHYNGDES